MAATLGRPHGKHARLYRVLWPIPCDLSYSPMSCVLQPGPRDCLRPVHGFRHKRSFIFRSKCRTSLFRPTSQAGSEPELFDFQSAQLSGQFH
jgi:hypothetical protein